MIKLNCDLGEGYGAWRMPHDELIMPHIDMANIACGFHAGDPLIMQQALQLACKHAVSIGAHPSYPDRQGFGRRSMDLTERELIPLLQYQIAALEGMAKIQNAKVDYVKPHGALYNNMMSNPEVFEQVLKAVREYRADLPLMIQSTPQWQSLDRTAEKYQVPILFEAFADRRYTDDGQLMSRKHADAVLPLTQIISQVDLMVKEQKVVTDSGKPLKLKIDSICVHGDSSDALDAVIHIRELISR